MEAQIVQILEESSSSKPEENNILIIESKTSSSDNEPNCCNDETCSCKRINVISRDRVYFWNDWWYSWFWKIKGISFKNEKYVRWNS